MSITHDTAYPTGLYIVDTGGHSRPNHRLLVQGPARNPDWSPDGRRIVFNAGEIFTVGPSGDSLIQVTNVGRAFFPSWSPDGESIAFNTGYKDPHGSDAVWIVRVDGSELHDISIHGTGEWLDPDWSPAGGVIVYLRYIGVGTPQVFEMDTSGTNQKRLTFYSDESYSPKWSPDGKSIAWARSNGIWLMNADGSQQRELIGNLAHDPCWSPDSRTIAFARGDAGPENVTKMVLWIVNADGSGLRQLTH